MVLRGWARLALVLVSATTSSCGLLLDLDPADDPAIPRPCFVAEDCLGTRRIPTSCDPWVCDAGRCVLSDPDGDGVGLGCAEADCDDDDPTMRASAVERCFPGTLNRCDEARSRVCSRGEWGPCSQAAAPQGEVCNGLDDDCDGTVDDDGADFVQQELLCLPQTECTPRGLRVEARTAMLVDDCDATDNDCDGEVDEDCAPSCLWVASASECASDGSLRCPYTDLNQAQTEATTRQLPICFRSECSGGEFDVTGDWPSGVSIFGTFDPSGQACAMDRTVTLLPSGGELRFAAQVTRFRGVRIAGSVRVLENTTLRMGEVTVASPQALRVEAGATFHGIRVHIEGQIVSSGTVRFEGQRQMADRRCEWNADSRVSLISSTEPHDFRDGELSALGTDFCGSTSEGLRVHGFGLRVFLFDTTVEAQRLALDAMECARLQSLRSVFRVSASGTSSAISAHAGCRAELVDNDIWGSPASGAQTTGVECRGECVLVGNRVVGSAAAVASTAAVVTTGVLRAEGNEFRGSDGETVGETNALRVEGGNAVLERNLLSVGCARESRTIDVSLGVLTMMANRVVADCATTQQTMLHASSAAAVISDGNSYWAQGSRCGVVVETTAAHFVGDAFVGCLGPALDILPLPSVDLHHNAVEVGAQVRVGGILHGTPDSLRRIGYDWFHFLTIGGVPTDALRGLGDPASPSVRDFSDRLRPIPPSIGADN